MARSVKKQFVNLSIYGNLKYAGELIVKSFNQVFGLPYTIIRPSALTEKDALVDE